MASGGVTGWISGNIPWEKAGIPIGINPLGSEGAGSVQLENCNSRAIPEPFPGLFFFVLREGFGMQDPGFVGFRAGIPGCEGAEINSQVIPIPGRLEYQE